MITQAQADEVIQLLTQGNETGSALRQKAMTLLDGLPEYHWSGIYRLEGDTLVLAEYVGAHTDHTHIPVGRGVCGTAVAEDRNQVIQDVRQLDNYLACSLETRSELVVLIRNADGSILGQIDIDGHTVGAFDQTDEALLERMAAVLAARWE